MRLNQKDKKINSTKTSEVLAELNAMDQQNNIQLIEREVSTGEIPENEVIILYQYWVDVKVRENRDGYPIKTHTFLPVAANPIDAEKIAAFLGRKRGNLKGISIPEAMHIAVAYYPNRKGQPDCTEAEKEAIWEAYTGKKLKRP